MAIIYHITTKPEWEVARTKVYYEAPSLQSEGFIHCSEEHQLDEVLKRYFAGKKDLLKLVIDTDKLTSILKYELAPSVNEMFPHIYGPVNFDAVIRIELIA